MNKKLILSVLVSLMSFVYSSATSSLVLTIEPQGLDPEMPENPVDPPERGHRSAPAPVYIEIDFESLSISGPEILEEVESYEIWDENHVACLCFTNDSSAFVETLSSLQPQTDYLIVMRTSDKTLSGYIYLSF